MQLHGIKARSKRKYKVGRDIHLVRSRWRDGCASGPPMFMRIGGSATYVLPSCRTAATDAAVEPACAICAFQAVRLRAWRVSGVTIWHMRSTRSEARRSASQRRARAAGQFVERARRSRSRDGHQGPRSPAPGRAALLILVGAAATARATDCADRASAAGAIVS